MNEEGFVLLIVLVDYLFDIDIEMFLSDVFEIMLIVF